MSFWKEQWQTPTLSAYAAHLRQLLHLERLARREPELTGLPLPEILDRLFPDLHLIWVAREDKAR
jgi:hypothetical protein